MKIASVLENQKIEKRIAITPEIAKKYLTLGFEVELSESYGAHIGIKDKEYTDQGVKISKADDKIINDADIIVQLGLMSDEKISLIKENQTLVGVFSPHINKDKLDNLIKKNIKNDFSVLDFIYFSIDEYRCGNGLSFGHIFLIILLAGSPPQA